MPKSEPTRNLHHRWGRTRVCTGGFRKTGVVSCRQGRHTLPIALDTRLGLDGSVLVTCGEDSVQVVEHVALADLEAGDEQGFVPPVGDRWGGTTDRQAQ